MEAVWRPANAPILHAWWHIAIVASGDGARLGCTMRRDRCAMAEGSHTHAHMAIHELRSQTWSPPCPVTCYHHTHSMRRYISIRGRSISGSSFSVFYFEKLRKIRSDPAPYVSRTHVAQCQIQRGLSYVFCSLSGYPIWMANMATAARRECLSMVLQLWLCGGEQSENDAAWARYPYITETGTGPDSTRIVQGI